jgi:dienelactone hydrolase
MRLLTGIAIAVSTLLAAVAEAAPATRPVSWTVGETTFDGVLVWDDANPAPRPGLLMVPNWYGVTDAAIAKAKTIADDDYVILLVDMYGRGVRPANPGEAGKAAGAVYADRAQMRQRINVALGTLRNAEGVPLAKDDIGAIGFCFGGATVIELARSGAELAGVASFHGALNTPAPATAGSVKTPLLVMNGADDAFVKPEEIAGFEKEMREAGADWQFVNYGGAVHCFAEPDEDGSVIPGCKFHEPSYRRSMALMRHFFAERFAD